MAQHTRLFANTTQLTTNKSVVDSRTVQSGATQAYRLGRSAATLVRHFVDYMDKKELFVCAEAEQITFTTLPIGLHVIRLTVGVRTVPLSMKAFRSLSTWAAAEGASATAKSVVASSSLDEASDKEKASRSPARSARPSAVVWATHSVLDAFSPVVCTDNCGFEESLARNKAEGDVWSTEHQTQLVLT